MPSVWGGMNAALVAVAQMGAYLARHGDGPTGWKTLWKCQFLPNLLTNLATSAILVGT